MRRFVISYSAWDAGKGSVGLGIIMIILDPRKEVRKRIAFRLVAPVQAVTPIQTTAVQLGNVATWSVPIRPTMYGVLRRAPQV